MQVEPLFQGKGYRNRAVHQEQLESLQVEAVNRTNPTLPTLPLLPIVCVACLAGQGSLRHVGIGKGGLQRALAGHEGGALVVGNAACRSTQQGSGGRGGLR